MSINGNQALNPSPHDFTPTFLSAVSLRVNSESLDSYDKKDERGRPLSYGQMAKPIAEDIRKLTHLLEETNR
jgi:hypothetical protein